MIYYFKRIDSGGNVVSLITCDTHLVESEEQIEITKDEYDELFANLPQPKPPVSDEATEADYIESLEELGVTFDE